MTPDVLNTRLIEAMKQKIPEGVNLAATLMDILSIGKEAVYRRFRGEVPFTLAETILISRELGVSLDSLYGISLGSQPLLDLSLSPMTNPAEAYYSIFDNYVNIFSKISQGDFVELWSCSNRLSLLLSMEYENISKFHLFKWLYQMNQIHYKNEFDNFDQMIFSSKLVQKQSELVRMLKQYKKSHFIWDPVIFLSIVNDIRYFKEINLISKDKLQALKSELIEMINNYEKIASIGYYQNGNEVDIYISAVNFETSYSYLESKTQKISFVKVYDLNTITSKDEKVFNSLKSWVHSLRKFSTLISQSAEMERYKFFNAQRAYVENL